MIRQRHEKVKANAGAAGTSGKAGGAMWRVFIALPLDENCKAHLARRQEDLRAALRRHALDGALAWTQPQNFHLTLRFVGDIAAECSAELAAAIMRASEGIAPFRLDLRELGCFPNSRNPRVVWAAVGGDLHALQTLQNRIERATAGWGQPLEARAFHPHLTLARVRNPNRKRDGRHEANHDDTQQRLEQQRLAQQESAQRIGEAVHTLSSGAALGAEESAWTAREVVLIRSELAAGGACYTKLASVPLAGFSPVSQPGRQQE